MKIAVFPGSFNPWHEGHDDVLNKALCVFDKIIIAVGVNPAKPQEVHDKRMLELKKSIGPSTQVEIVEFKGLLVNWLKENKEVVAVVRGIRNGDDFAYEQSQQYWSEDLMSTVPWVFFIADRSLVHYSSSAVRYLKDYT